MFYYEYGYLCFQLMVLAVQAIILTRDAADGFKIYANTIKIAEIPSTPALLTAYTILQLEADDQTFQSDDPVKRYQIKSGSVEEKRLALAATGGISDLDSFFLIRALWDTRKELSYIGSKTATPGWCFVIEILFVHLMQEFKTGK